MIKTIRLPTNDAPNQPRVTQDGRTVLVNTVACRLYHVSGLAETDSHFEMVHQETPSDARGDRGHWVQANAADHRVFSVDIHDLPHVHSVSSVSFDGGARTGSPPTAHTSSSSTNQVHPPSVA